MADAAIKSDRHSESDRRWSRDEERGRPLPPAPPGTSEESFKPEGLETRGADRLSGCVDPSVAGNHGEGNGERSGERNAEENGGGSGEGRADAATVPHAQGVEGQSPAATSDATAKVRQRSLSPEHARSRSRERRRRKAQAECIRRAGGFQKLADSEGKEPVRLFWDGFQWVAKTGNTSALLADPILVNSTRKLRRLYFGNLPLHLGLTETNFQSIVFGEMKRRGLCNRRQPAAAGSSATDGLNPESSGDGEEVENPVLCVWFARDKGNYGFVEFASVEETERALTMDGMNCLGLPVRVSRPNDYCTSAQAPTLLPTFAQQSAKLLAETVPTLATGGLAQLIVAGGAAASAGGGEAQTTHGRQDNGVVGEGSSLKHDNDVEQDIDKNKTSNSTSRLLMLKAIVQATDVESPEDYEEFLLDIKEGCESSGKVSQAAIVTPSDELGAAAEFELGDVYLMFETREAADACFEKFRTLKYFERPISARRLPEEMMEESVIPKLKCKV